MKRIFFLVMICFLLIPTFGFAFDPISGGFGMKLGGTFDPDPAMGIDTMKDGTPLYTFATTKPFRSFNTYHVIITPKSKKIYGILAIGPAENMDKCKKERAVILEILTKKYGEPDEEKDISFTSDKITITQQDREVSVNCAGLLNMEIRIMYLDKLLAQQAERERIELESEKVDASGL